MNYAYSARGGGIRGWCRGKVGVIGRKGGSKTPLVREITFDLLPIRFALGTVVDQHFGYVPSPFATCVSFGQTVKFHGGCGGANGRHDVPDMLVDQVACGSVDEKATPCGIGEDIAVSGMMPAFLRVGSADARAIGELAQDTGKGMSPTGRLVHDEGRPWKKLSETHGITGSVETNGRHARTNAIVGNEDGLVACSGLTGITALPRTINPKSNRGPIGGSPGIERCIGIQP